MDRDDWLMIAGSAVFVFAGCALIAGLLMTISSDAEEATPRRYIDTETGAICYLWQGSISCVPERPPTGGF